MVWELVLKLEWKIMSIHFEVSVSKIVCEMYECLEGCQPLKVHELSLKAYCYSFLNMSLIVWYQMTYIGNKWHYLVKYHKFDKLHTFREVAILVNKDDLLQFGTILI